MAHGRTGSSPVIRTTSEQALYRLLRLFSKVRARSRRYSSSPNRSRCRWASVWFFAGPICSAQTPASLLKARSSWNCKVFWLLSFPHSVPRKASGASRCSSAKIGSPRSRCLALHSPWKSSRRTADFGLCSYALRMSCVTAATFVIAFNRCFSCWDLFIFAHFIPFCMAAHDFLP